MLIGRLGRDPELRYTPNGKAVVNMRLAVNRRARATDTGETLEETDWFTVNAWDKLAEICAQYLSKGSKVYVEGRLQTRSWEQDGHRRSATEVVASDMIILDTRSGGNSGSSGGSQEEDLADLNLDEIPF